MDILNEVTEGGVTERRFDLKVDDEVVPGIIWAPEGAAGPRPLVLICHGGSQHKRVVTIVNLARNLASHHGYACVSIDAPNHGDRLPESERGLTREERRARAAQAPPDDAQQRERGTRNSRAVSDWKATLDAVEQLDYVGKGGPVGYWGVSMGTGIGIPLVASEPRIRAAILGLAGLRPDRPGSERTAELARSIKIPLLFMFQWDDGPDGGVKLFEQFGSEIKSMHLNPGPHTGIPPHEREYFETFYVRHLGTAAAPITS